MGTRRWRLTVGFTLVAACARVPVEPVEVDESSAARAVVEADTPANRAAAPPSTVDKTDTEQRVPLSDGGLPEVAQILSAARDGKAFARLVSLCDDVGHRFSGSPSYLRAVQWGLDRFNEDDVPVVNAEPIEVPTWVRGDESARLDRKSVV